MDKEICILVSSNLEYISFYDVFSSPPPSPLKKSSIINTPARLLGHALPGDYFPVTHVLANAGESSIAYLHLLLTMHNGSHHPVTSSSKHFSESDRQSSRFSPIYILILFDSKLQCYHFEHSNLDTFIRFLGTLLYFHVLNSS